MRIIETTQYWNESHYFAERVRNALRYADLLVVSEAEDAFSQKTSRPCETPRLLELLPGELRSRVLFDQVDLKPHAHLGHFEREAVVRNSAFKRLKRERLVRPDDLVLVQDFDEFFDPACREALLRHFRFFWRRYVHLTYRCTYYFLNNQIVHPADHLRWRHQVAFRASHGWRDDFCVHRLRTGKPRRRTQQVMGWHHSYLGTFEFIAQKVRAFAHADDAILKDVPDAALAERIARGEDLFGRDFRFRLLTDYARCGIPDLAQRADLFAPGGPTAPGAGPAL
jgi:hypothetical protein